MLLAHPNRVILVMLAGLGFAAAVFGFSHRAPIRVRVFDRGFHVMGFGAVAAKRTNQVFYLGNPLLGRVQDRLATLGVGIKEPLKGSFTMGSDDPGTFMAVAYNGKLTPEELGAVQAELVNGDGTVLNLCPVRGNPIWRIGSNYYYGHWLVNLNARHRRSTNNSSSYIVRLRRASGGAKLAEIEFQNPQK
jgi:hypothetical protein